MTKESEKKLNILLNCMYIFTLIATIVTHKYCSPYIWVFFWIWLMSTSIAIIITGIKVKIRDIKEYKEHKRNESWYLEHVTYLPLENKFIFNIDKEPLEKWQEDIISATEENFYNTDVKIIVNSPLSKIINNYYS